ncbi:hypothetical protein FRC10_008687, partial [Ceratobasidium sp. 414]
IAAGTKLIEDMVNLVDLRYHRLLVATTLRRDVDDALAEMDRVMVPMEELVQDSEVFIAQTTLKVLGQSPGVTELSLSSIALKESMFPLSPQLFSSSFYEKTRSPSAPNGSRWTRVTALYAVAREHSRGALVRTLIPPASPLVGCLIIPHGQPLG